MTLRMSAGELNGYIVVAVGGEVDLSNADALQTQLIEVLDERGSDLIVDVAELSFVDSSGLLALMNALKYARRLGGTLRLAAPQRAVAKVLQVTDVWDLFGVLPSIEAARTDEPDGRRSLSSSCASRLDNARGRSRAASTGPTRRGTAHSTDRFERDESLPR